MQNSQIAQNVMDPPFEVLLHDPAYSQFRTDKGKICITNHKVPRPQSNDDTTVPKLKYNGIVINPVKFVADKKEYKRNKQELDAFEAWRQDIKQRQSAIAQERIATKEKTEEQQQQNNEQKKEKRKKTATEAKSLVWWISYQAQTEFAVDDDLSRSRTNPRFGGCRKKAFEDTLRVLALAYDWQQYCEKQNIECRDMLYDAEYVYDVESPTTQVSDDVESPTTQVSDDDEDMDADVFQRETFVDEEGNIVICGGKIPEKASEKLFTEVFQNWWLEHHKFKSYIIYDYERHCKGRVHWDVTCLERPQDMNVLLKLKNPLSDKLVKEALFILKIGQERGEKDRDCYMYPEVTRCQHAFSIARYLAFGYCGDGHKTYEHCDMTPRFGSGDIDIPNKHMKTWLKHAIQLAGATHVNDLKPSKKDDTTWLFKISCVEDATEKKINDLFDVLYVDDSIPSTPAIRLQKIHECARAAKPTDSLLGLFQLLCWHMISPSEFKEKVLTNLTGNRDIEPLPQWAKRHLSFLGYSNSGKSALSGPIYGSERQVGILESVLAPCEGGVMGWSKSNGFQYRKCLDVLIVDELEKAMETKTISSLKFVQMTNGLAQFVPYRGGFRFNSNLPIAIHTQHGKYKRKDAQCIKNRSDVIHLKGGEIPETSDDDGWYCSRWAMAKFLTTEIELPDWFAPLYTDFSFELAKRDMHIKRIKKDRTKCENEREDMINQLSMECREVRVEIFKKMFSNRFIKKQTKIDPFQNAIDEEVARRMQQLVSTGTTDEYERALKKTKDWRTRRSEH